MTVTTEQRARWRRLADEATPGPWRLHDGEADGDGETGHSLEPNVLWLGALDEDGAANARFIAAAREAVPALLDALDEADRENERLKDYSCAAGRSWLAGAPHADPDECPTFYDGCHCTTVTLAYNIERAERAESERDALALRVRGLEAMKAEVEQRRDKWLASPRNPVFWDVRTMQLCGTELRLVLERLTREHPALSPPATPGATPTNRNEE